MRDISKESTFFYIYIYVFVIHFLQVYAQLLLFSPTSVHPMPFHVQLSTSRSRLNQLKSVLLNHNYSFAQKSALLPRHRGFSQLFGVRKANRLGIFPFPPPPAPFFLRYFFGNGNYEQTLKLKFVSGFCC